MLLRVALVVAVASFAPACSNSHAAEAEVPSEGDFNVPGADGGPTDTPPDDREPPTPDDPNTTPDEPALPTCGDIHADPGHVQAVLTSFDLGDVPLDLAVSCGPNGKAFMVHAADGLSTFALSLPLEDRTGDIAGNALLDFESLARFSGVCSVCADDAGLSGTISCSTLVWTLGDDAVKASLVGSYRCPE